MKRKNKQVNEKAMHQGAPFNSYIKSMCVNIYIYTHTHTFMHSYLTRIGQSSCWTDSSKIKDRQEQKNSQTQSAGSTHDQGDPVLKLGLVKEKIGKIMTRCDPADQAG